MVWPLSVDAFLALQSTDTRNQLVEKNRTGVFRVVTRVWCYFCDCSFRLMLGISCEALSISELVYWIIWNYVTTPHFCSWDHLTHKNFELERLCMDLKSEIAVLHHQAKLRWGVHFAAASLIFPPSLPPFPSFLPQYRGIHVDNDIWYTAHHHYYFHDCSHALHVHV